MTFRNVTYYSIDLTDKNILRIDLMSAGISDIFDMYLINKIKYILNC